jgi:DNA ligase N terminus
MKSGSK